MDEKQNCTTCEHSVFDEKWGEYKCKLFQHKIYNVEKMSNCLYHDKK
jgi:hypothetical protein